MSELGDKMSGLAIRSQSNKLPIHIITDAYKGKQKGREIHRQERGRYSDKSLYQYVKDLRRKTEERQFPKLSDVFTDTGVFALFEPRSRIKSRRSLMPTEHKKAEKRRIIKRDFFSKQSMFQELIDFTKACFEENTRFTDEDGFVPEIHRDKQSCDIDKTLRTCGDRYMKMLVDRGEAKECPEERDEMGFLVTFHVFVVDEGKKDEKGKKSEMSRIVGTTRMFVRAKDLRNMTERMEESKGRLLSVVSVKKLNRLINTEEAYNEINKYGYDAKLEVSTCIDVVPMNSDYMKKVIGIIPFKKSVECNEYCGILPCFDTYAEFREYNSLVKAEMGSASRNIITEEEREGVDLDDGIIVH